MISMPRHGRLARRQLRRHFHRPAACGDSQPSKPKRRFSVHISTVCIPGLVVAALLAATYWVNPATMVAAWSVVASPAVSAGLFGIVLTLGVCGALASAAIWWICLRELRANQRLQATMREFLDRHAQGQSDPENRQAA